MPSKAPKPVSRRQFFKVSGGVLAATCLPGLLGCEPTPEATPEPEAGAGSEPALVTAQIPIGVQLFCFRHQMAEDVPGTLASVAALGFEGFEFAGYYDYSAADLRTMLDDNGVRCCGTHLGMDALLGDALEQTIAFNLELGNEYLIVAGIGDERTASKDAVLRTAEEFNEIAEKLKPHGLYTGYHCHAYSFNKPLDGDNIWNLLANNTTDDVVLQLDTGNAAHGGANIPAVIQAHPGRINSMHVKPYTAAAEEPFEPFIGDDDLPWAEIFDLSESVGGIQWYVVEYEQESHPPLDALKANRANMLKIKSMA